MDSEITICLPKFLWGHKNSFDKTIELMIAANPVCLYSTSFINLSLNRRPMVGVL